MLSEQLRDEFLRRSGVFDGLERSVDPGDEMLKTISRHAVREHHDLQTYFRRGLDAFHVLEHVQGALGRPLSELGAVLDFAAGWGRVTRLLVRDLDPSRVFVSDIAEESMAWCRRALGVRSFDSDLDPSRVQPPSHFDLIFVGSLFTHLPRARFEDWMKTLLSWLTPDGSLVFTTHGDERLEPQDRCDSGFTYIDATPIDYLPVSEYASTYVRPSLVREIVIAAGAAQIVSRECDLWFRHDVNVARREVAPKLESITRTPIALGRIERAAEVRPGHGWVGGTVTVPRVHLPLRSVDLWIDGQRFGPFSRLQESDAPLDGPGMARFEFVEEGDVSGLGAGEHLVAAVVQWDSGETHCLDAVSMTVG